MIFPFLTVSFHVWRYLEIICKNLLFQILLFIPTINRYDTQLNPKNSDIVQSLILIFIMQFKV